MRSSAAGGSGRGQRLLAAVGEDGEAALQSGRPASGLRFGQLQLMRGRQGCLVPGACQPLRTAGCLARSPGELSADGAPLAAFAWIWPLQ